MTLECASLAAKILKLGELSRAREPSIARDIGESYLRGILENAELYEDPTQHVCGSSSANLGSEPGQLIAVLTEKMRTGEAPLPVLHGENLVDDVAAAIRLDKIQNGMAYKKDPVSFVGIQCLSRALDQADVYSLPDRLDPQHYESLTKEIHRLRRKLLLWRSQDGNIDGTLREPMDKSEILGIKTPVQAVESKTFERFVEAFKAREGELVRLRYENKALKDRLNKLEVGVAQSREDLHMQRKLVEEATTCPICLNTRLDSVLQCGHSFCRKCIDRWGKPFCVMCWQPIRTIVPFFPPGFVSDN